MLGLVDAGFPSISRRDVLVQRARLPLARVEILAIGPVRDGVVGPKESSRAQLGEEEVGQILE